MKEEITTIKLKKTTLEKLKKLGSMGETYDDVVNVILEKYITRKKVNNLIIKPLKNKK